MAPSEFSILSNFLLKPASLPGILSLPTFTDLVPQSQQNDLQIKSLYLNLKSERAFNLEHIRRNIDHECKRGERQRRQVIKARRQPEKHLILSDDLAGTDFDIEVSDSVANAPNKDSLHTFSSILPEMEQACNDLEADIAAAEAESETVLKELETMVGDLSDLKYGRFGKPVDSSQDLQETVLEGLRLLDKACKAKLEG